MDDDRAREKLNALDEQLAALITIADELEDHMLAALLYQARDRVALTYHAIRI